MDPRIERWHHYMHESNPDMLDDLLADDCVFISPVVHTPQEGKAISKLYLTSAMHVFNDSFRYTKEIVTPEHIVLEFECDMEGIIVNGIDMMTFNEEGKITEFKVMVRPLKGVNMLHARMKAMLEQLATERSA